MPGHRESRHDIGILPQHLVNAVLNRASAPAMSLRGAMKTPKTTLLSPGGKNALGTTMKNQTVPARQTTQIKRRDPAMREEPPERSAINAENAFLDAADHALHPGFFRAFAALLEQPRAHERRQRQRHQTRMR